MNLCRLLTVVAILITGMASAQQGTLSKRSNVIINDNCHGFLEYLPYGYNTNTTQKYPLMIYLNGIGSTGDGSDAQLENEFSGGNYPHEQQRAGTWPDAFTVNGQTYQLLIITPQFIAPMGSRFPTPDEVNDVINYAIQHYRIDTTRIYLMGQSQGGGTVWEYAAHSSAYANRIAAIVPFSGVSFPFQEKANIIKNAHIAVWAFHNLRDNLVPVSFTIDYVNMINSFPTPAIPAKKTIFDADGHLSWFGALSPSYTEDGLNVYQFLLQYKKTPTTVFAGEDQELMLPANSAQLHGTGTGPNGTAASYSWTKISGPATGGNFSNAIIPDPVVSNLVQGTYTYRLTITDNAGGTSTDDVAVVVNPGAQRIEAENYVASSGTMVRDNTTDGGTGSQRMNNIDANDWLEYNVTVPTAGNYMLRFRAGTFYGGTQINVEDAAQNVLATVTMYATNWDDYMNLYATVPLQAGTQRIRIANGNPASNVWFLNWFEVIDNTPDQTVLPVNFTLFNAACANGGVNLLWKTSGETNSRDFVVEKSNDGSSWIALTTIPAAGQSSTERTYSYRDEQASGTGFYRIAQHDRDGRSSYTSIIRSSCSGDQTLRVFPNPVRTQATISLNTAQSTKLSLSLSDVKGSIVRRQESLLPQGNSQLSLDMSGLAPGTYTLRATWNNQTSVIKLVKE